MAKSIVTLRADIRSFLARSQNDPGFTDDNLNAVISLGEQRLWQALKDIALEQVVNFARLVAGSPFIKKPNDWYQTKSIIVGNEETPYKDSTILLKRDFEFCITFNKNSSTQNDISPKPKYYCDKANQNNQPNQAYNLIFISPTPAKQYYYQITYDAIPTSLITANTNIYTERFYNLLLYACLVEASTFVKASQETKGSYLQAYQTLLETALQEKEARKTDRNIDNSN
jgi:hypothetical protein